MHKTLEERERRRVTVNLPGDLVKSAQKVSKSTITDTLIEGLRLVRERGAYEKALSLKGKIHLDIDLPISRERTGR